MATVKELREVVAKAAEWAIEREPANANYRAGLFLAYLAGRLEGRDPAIAAALDRVRTFDAAKASSEQGA